MERMGKFAGKVVVLPGLPASMNKKADVARSTLRKLDTVLYELSLARKSRASDEDATGGGGGSSGGGVGGGGDA